MKYVLKPSEFPEECYLNQALNWATFQIFPDINLEYETSLEFLKEQEFDDFFDPDIKYLADETFCKKFNLPENIFWKEYPNSYLPKVCYEDLSQLDRWCGDSATQRLKILNERDEALKYYSKEDLFDKAIKEKYELFQAEIFVHLKRGNLKARGIPLLDSPPKIDEDGECEISQNWYERGYTPISQNLWSMDSIDWETNTLGDKNQLYGRILVSTEQLFHLYPSHSDGTVMTKKMGEVYILDTDEKLQISTRGRPSFPWHEFTAELVHIMQEEGLPKLQKDILHRMEDWCIEKWGKAPSETNLKDKIAPFYEGQKMVKKS